MDALPRVVLICASRSSPKWFERETLLGRSLHNFPEQLRPEAHLLLNNHGDSLTGLSEFYNSALDAIEGDAFVVFVHDDVYIHDWNLRFTLSQALCFWDVVGVVGGAGVPYGQPSWSYQLDGDGERSVNPHVTHSGSINQFDPVNIRPDFYGPAPMQCDLLDGVFLAADLQRLRQKNVRFDPAFKFHCYDIDFCYAARAQGLTLGTWPIMLTHGSPGSWDERWKSEAFKLQQKLGVL